MGDAQENVLLRGLDWNFVELFSFLAIPQSLELRFIRLIVVLEYPLLERGYPLLYEHIFVYLFLLLLVVLDIIQESVFFGEELLHQLLRDDVLHLIEETRLDESVECFEFGGHQDGLENAFRNVTE